MGTASPGRYKSDFVPYVREPLEAFVATEVRQIALCWSAQSSKTMTELLMLGYTIAEDPGPAMFIMPAQSFARSVSEQRIQPMIEDNKVLRVHKLEDRHKFKLEEMTLDNMTIYIRWAGSPSALSSVAIRYLFEDEIDKWETATDKEAGPHELAEERTKTFHNRKIVKSSTPTVESGAIWKALTESDYREYHVPCPHCGAFITFVWKNLRFNPEVSEVEVRKSVYYECQACANHIVEASKLRMTALGKWIPRNPDTDPSTRSYHLNEMYSPWSKWGDLAVKFLRATKAAKAGQTEGLQNFINSSLAEPWRAKTESVRKFEELEVLVDDRPQGLVPSEGVKLITCGADTQDHGFYFVVRAWGEDYTSWLLRSGFVETLEVLEDIIYKQTYKDVEGREYRVGHTLIDAMGHRTSEVYSWCTRQRAVNPAKGEQKMATPFKSTRIETFPGTDTPIPGSMFLLRHHTTHYKDWLNNKFTIIPTDSGAFHIHSKPSPDYLRQLSTEYRDDKGIWRCPPHKPNHFWDCEVLSLVAADFKGLKYLPDYHAKESARPQPAPQRDRPKKALRGGLY